MREFHAAFAAQLAAPAEGAMAIYRNTMTAVACEALADNFPVIRELLGDEMFAAVAADHAADHPPANPVLAHYGAAFAGWIETQSWSADLPYLSAVARVERLFCEALFAADAAPLDPAAFGQLAPHQWGDARLTLHPATRFACSPWPAAGLWLAHRDSGDLAALDWQAECVLVTRPHQTVRVEAFCASGHCFLQSIAHGQSVGGAVETTLAAFPDTDITPAFTLFLERGVFAALDT